MNQPDQPEPKPITKVQKPTGNNDIGITAFHTCAIENYARWWGLPADSATIEQVESTSSGVLGWASYNGPGMHPAYSPPPISSSVPRQQIIENRNRKKRQDIDRMHEYYDSTQGQQRIAEIALERETDAVPHPCGSRCL